MTSQLSAHFNKVWFPPPSNPSSLLFYVSAYLQTRAHFIRTYQSRSEQRGGLPQSERSVSQPAVQNGDKKKRRGQGEAKKLLLREHNPTECLSVNGKCEKKKKYSPSVISEKRTFSEAERVGSQSFLGPCNPTSTSPLAERNMQTHFIDFWSFAEKPTWTFRRCAHFSRSNNKTKARVWCDFRTTVERELCQK